MNLRLVKVLMLFIAVTVPALLGLTGLKPVAALPPELLAQAGRAGQILVFSGIAAQSPGQQRLQEDGHRVQPTEMLSSSTVAAVTRHVYLPVIIRPLSETDIATRVVNRTNFYRAQSGCSPLVLHPQLTAAAQGHSTDMALHDFVSHIGSDGSLPADRAEAAGYVNWAALAENAAAGHATPELVVDSWMSSPDHRESILNCNFKDIGVGYYYLQNDTGLKNYHHYWTQLFGVTR